VSKIENLKDYYVAMHIAKRLLSLKLITEDDFWKIEQLIANKYCIKDSSIYRLNDLIDISLRGTIVHTKG